MIMSQGQERFHLEGKKYDYIGPAYWPTLNPDKALTLLLTGAQLQYLKSITYRGADTVGRFPWLVYGY